jgi:glycogen operon protein
MVKTFHRAGIEVLLDVVYNHTGEGTHLGPTLCFRGIDNRTYYRLVPHESRFNEDLTGTGNTLNASHPQVLAMILDSLRYWVEEMHVDGFRFDLAPALGRDPADFDPGASFFDCVHQDPVLSRVKLIAEPWDLGHGGYQLGSFPTRWTEWNDRFRDAARAFWLGHQSGVWEISRRFAGSPDIFGREEREPTSSVNFVTAHDGFTLWDLVSYDAKHNEVNGEENRDGSSHNLSNNHGMEGPTDDPTINAIRARQVRNLLATLLLSRGVPMILAGDEVGRSQGGNNNAYCQDNEIGWVSWSEQRVDRDLLAFTSLLAEVRAGSPAVRGCSVSSVDSESSSEIGGVAWFHPAGRQMTSQDWADGSLTALGIRLADARADLPSVREADVSGTILVLINAGRRSVTFRLPPIDGDPTLRWLVVVDTSASGGESGRTHGADRIVRLPDRTMVVLTPTAHRARRRARPGAMTSNRRRGR